MGKLCMQMGRWEQAAARFNRLLESVPRDHEANWLMVRCLKNMGRVDDAVGRLEMLAEIAPNDDKVWREMGMIYLNEKGDMDTAREMFARSLSLNPDQPELTFLIGQLQYPQQSRPQLPGFTPPMPGAELPLLPDVRPMLPQIPGQPTP